MTKCESQYTIDRRTGESLVCDRTYGKDHEIARDMHGAMAYGLRWYWRDDEADK